MDSRWIMGVAMLWVTVGLTGCGSSPPPRSQDEVNQKAAEHGQIAQEQMQKYKGGGPRRAHGAPQ